MVTPRLITPNGKTIELSPETYKQIQKLLRDNKQVKPNASQIARVEATYGKYAGKTSLTQALLKARKEDIDLEEAKMRRHNG